MVMSGDREYVMNNYPEPDKRLIYQFKCEAHERELHRELMVQMTMQVPDNLAERIRPIGNWLPD
jgi:hypothetical protein